MPGLERLGAVYLGMFEIPANETLDLGDVLVPEAATLNVDWRTPGEAAEYSYVLEQSLRASDPRPEQAGWTGWWRMGTWTGQGQPTALRVFAGRLTLSISRRGTLIERLEVDAQTGEIVQVTVGAAR